MEKGVIISFVAAVIAVAALGITSWLSIRSLGTARDEERLAFDRFKAAAGGNAAELERKVALATERSAELEKSVLEAGQRAAQAQKQAAALEKEAVETRVRTERAQADQASKHAEELEKAAAEIRMRSEEARIARDALELARAFADAKARVDQTPDVPAEKRTAETRSRPGNAGVAPVPPAGQPEFLVERSAIVSILAKFAGAKAAIYVLDEAADAPGVGSSINAILTEAAWAPAVWRWSGVGGIVGVVVLTSEGNDPATDTAAARLVDAFRLAGLNITKANWPGDWRRYRGALAGPQTPKPTDAPIRIVIGAQPRR
jgi:hypothetical protein